MNSSKQPFISDSISISTSVNKSIPQNFTVSSGKIKCYLATSNGVQGKTLVSNCTSFSDITSKCVLSTVPVTNLYHIPVSYSSLSCPDATSKSLLSTVDQINTSCSVNPNDKYYSSSYSKVFSKPIAKYMKYSSFKTEEPLPLEDGICLMKQ